MQKENGLDSVNNNPSSWREFLLSLSSIFTLAVGTGAFLLLIISYLESQKIPTDRIGLVMSFFSSIQAIAVFLIGKYYTGNHFRLVVILALISQGSGVVLLSVLPTGLLLWVAMALFGTGLGILLVVLYASAIQRRPQSVRASVSIGVYTALVAGGNALGAPLAGEVIDLFGYAAAFLFSGSIIFLVIFVVIFMADHWHEQPTVSEDQAADAPADDRTLPRWKLGIAMAFLMASLAAVFDTLLPIYGLRAGLANATIGSLAGFKMFMAAATRPLTGLLLSRVSPYHASNLGMLGMVIAAVLFPYSGLGMLVFASSGMFGLSFGTIRVASLTSTLEGQTQSRVITRRLSQYRLSMTFGQIVGPYLAGLTAAAIAVSSAIISLSLVHFFLFLGTLVAFKEYPRIKSLFPSRKPADN